MRFEAYGWHVQFVADVNDLQALDDAVPPRRQVTDKPSLVIVRTHIGYGSPNKQDTASAHGSPLGVEEIKLTKENLGIPSMEPFYVAPRSARELAQDERRGAKLQAEWDGLYKSWKHANPDLAPSWNADIRGTCRRAGKTRSRLSTQKNGNVATRSASGAVINAIAPHVPELIGGSADLATSTDTIVKGAPSFGRRYSSKAATFISAFASMGWAAS